MDCISDELIESELHRSIEAIAAGTSGTPEEAMAEAAQIAPSVNDVRAALRDKFVPGSPQERVQEAICRILAAQCSAPGVTVEAVDRQS